MRAKCSNELTSVVQERTVASFQDPNCTYAQHSTQGYHDNDNDNDNDSLLHLDGFPSRDS